MDDEMEEKVMETTMKTKYDKYIKLLKANHNIVLSGAPGTGKTYLAKEIAKEMGAEVGFVQFHPSYDYTDFVEGLRPTLDKGFERKDGVFKDFCKKALLQKTETIESISYISNQGASFDEAYKILVDDIKSHRAVLYSDFRARKTQMQVRVDSSVRILGKEKIEFFKTNDYQNAQIEYLMKLYNHYLSRNIFDVRNERFNDFVKIIGNTLDYSYYRGIVQGLLDRTEKKDEDYFPNIQTSIETKETASNTFVFIIDEINRGEISKIFGELFFSIDPDYRGEKGKVKTQYQSLVPDDDEFSDGFFVPENVYIIGTMNDIDRSVEPMDFAMRRRFVWEEITAEDSAKNMGIEGEDLVRMTRLNEQIERTEGLSKDYQLGGYYFLKKPMEAEERWNLKIKSLLKEYLRGIDLDGTKLEALRKAYFEPVAEE